MKSLLTLAFLVVGASMVAIPRISMPALFPSQESKDFENNRCVTCHRNITVPVALSHRYYDWHLSIHKEKGVGCEACHGGDASRDDARQAHTGMLPSSDPASRTHWKNQSETCGRCHTEIRSALAASAHQLRLGISEIGPACTTCHRQMANSTVRSPQETAALCASCHNSQEGLMPPRPELVRQAEEVVLALSRANGVIIWADRLIEVAQSQRVTVTDEATDLEQARRDLREAKIQWHTFRFEPVRTQADRAFTRATAVKDRLMKKLYPGRVGN